MTAVRDVMTEDPIVLDARSTATDAARAMRDSDVGMVLVRKDDELCGLVTDRDLVLRVIDDGADPGATVLGDICSSELHSVTPGDDLADAVALMRQHAVRRIPVVDGTRPVGVLSIGDLAVVQDPSSALADISVAEPNR